MHSFFVYSSDFFLFLLFRFLLLDVLWKIAMADSSYFTSSLYSNATYENLGRDLLNLYFQYQTVLWTVALLTPIVVCYYLFFYEVQYLKLIFKNLIFLFNKILVNFLLLTFKCLIIIQQSFTLNEQLYILLGVFPDDCSKIMSCIS